MVPDLRKAKGGTVMRTIKAPISYHRLERFLVQHPEMHFVTFNCETCPVGRSLGSWEWANLEEDCTWSQAFFNFLERFDHEGERYEGGRIKLDNATVTSARTLEILRAGPRW